MRIFLPLCGEGRGEEKHQKLLLQCTSTRNMKNGLKITGFVITFLGLAITLSDLKGWLPNPRMVLANKIMRLGENTLPFNTPNVDDLVIHFLSKKNPKLTKNNLGKYLRDCKGIEIENLIFDGHDTVGSVRIAHKDGIKAEIICGFQDLQKWAAEYQIGKWIGLILAFIGLILNLLIFFWQEYEFRGKSTRIELSGQ